MNRDHRSSLVAFTLGGVIVLAIAVLGAVFAASASAQTPAVCDQYPDLPQCTDSGGGGGDTDSGDDGLNDDDGTDDEGAPGVVGDGGGTTSGPTGTIGKGELPFTGYPLTPLILLLLLLLLLGLAIRGYLAIRERLRVPAAAGDSPIVF